MGWINAMDDVRLRMRKNREEARLPLNWSYPTAFARPPGAT